MQMQMQQKLILQKICMACTTFLALLPDPCIELINYQCCRLLAKGDVFAMPSDPGGTYALLSSLYPSQPPQPHPPELQYFKVTSLEPSCGTSCAIDFTKTQVMLEVPHSLAMTMFSSNTSIQLPYISNRAPCEL